MDSTVVIDLLRGFMPAGGWIEQQQEVLAASEVTRAEVLRALRSPERYATRRVLEGYRWFPVDADVASRAGELGRRYRTSHNLDIADLLVAATADVQHLRLVTSDVRHFPMVEALEAPY